MNTSQLTLLTHATEQLAKTQQHLLHSGTPLPLKTATVAEYLQISGSTLNRAKNDNDLPYKLSYNEKIAEISFSHHWKGKDYWFVKILDNDHDPI